MKLYKSRNRPKSIRNSRNRSSRSRNRPKSIRNSRNRSCKSRSRSRNRPKSIRNSRNRSCKSRSRSRKSKRRSAKKSKRFKIRFKDGMMKEKEAYRPIIFYFNEDLIFDTSLYYDNAFNRTLYFFKNVPSSSINKLITELFTYGRDENIIMYVKRITIFSYFIITHNIYIITKLLIKYTRPIEPIIDKNGLITSENNGCYLNTVKKSNKFMVDFFKCLDKYKSDYDKCKNNKIKFKELYNLIDTSPLYRDILYDIINVVYLIKDSISKEQYLEYFKRENLSITEKDEVIIDIILKLTNFIYICSCVDSYLVTRIINNYILNLLKTDHSYNYNMSLQLEEDIKYTIYERNIFNKFTLANSPFKIIDYITGLKSKWGVFSTCGETTLLNLLNYYLINSKGIFNIDKISSLTSSSPVKTFYNKYPNMDLQFKSIENTMLDWLEVVSTLPKPSKNSSIQYIYNIAGDIHNNKKIIEYVLKYILNSNNNNIKDILKDIDKTIYIDIISETENDLVLNVNNKFKVFFRSDPGHGGVINLDTYDIPKTKLSTSLQFEYVDEFGKIGFFFGVIRTGKYNDFIVIYNLNRLINDNYDYTNEINKIISTYLTYPKSYKILSLFCSTLKKITIYIPYGDKFFRMNFNEFINLEFLEITNISRQSLYNSFDNLIKLKDLTLDYSDVVAFSKVNLTSAPLKGCLDPLIQLEKLTIKQYDNDFTNIFNTLENLKDLTLLNPKNILGNSFDNLKNLNTLYIENYTKDLGTTLYNCKNLEKITLINAGYDPKVGVPDNAFNNSTNLKELIIEKYPYNLNRSLYNLHSLEKLNIKHYNKDLKDSLNMLNNLKYLKLPLYDRSFNRSLDSLVNLEILNANSYACKLGDSLKMLTNLKELNLASYDHYIGDSFKTLNRLKSLSLNNFNRDFEKSLEPLTSLERLSLQLYNKPIGKSFSTLINLKSLTIPRYNLALTDSLYTLVNLESLTMDLYTINEELAFDKLVNLKKLKLGISYNALESNFLKDRISNGTIKYTTRDEEEAEEEDVEEEEE